MSEPTPITELNVLFAPGRPTPGQTLRLVPPRFRRRGDTHAQSVARAEAHRARIGNSTRQD